MSSLRIFLIFVAILFASLAVGIAQYRSSRYDSMACIFCDIVNKSSDTELLYEDEVNLIRQTKKK